MKKSQAAIITSLIKVAIDLAISSSASSDESRKIVAILTSVIAIVQEMTE